MQVLYEDVSAEDVESVTISGAYFIGGNRNKNFPVSFFILDPLKKPIYSRRSKTEGVFMF